MTETKSDNALMLYNWPTSTCSQKLAENSLPFEDRRLKSGKNENQSNWYLKLNENGGVSTRTATASLSTALIAGLDLNACHVG